MTGQKTRTLTLNLPISKKLAINSICLAFGKKPFPFISHCNGLEEDADKKRFEINMNREKFHTRHSRFDVYVKYIHSQRTIGKTNMNQHRLKVILFVLFLYLQSPYWIPRHLRPRGQSSTGLQHRQHPQRKRRFLTRIKMYRVSTWPLTNDHTFRCYDSTMF